MLTISHLVFLSYYFPMARKLESPDHKRIPEPDIKVHPWRICVYGEYPRKTHPLKIDPSKKNPAGITTRHFNCAKNPDYKDVLYPHEIQLIEEMHFASLSGPPKAYDFGKHSIGNSYDSLIRGWTKYWNEVLKPSELLDPNIVKTLIFTESTFRLKLLYKGARGLMQLRPTSVKALKNYKGELKDHFVILTRDDLFDPNLSICGGIRWLFHKKRLREAKLKRTVSWIEAVAEYKGRPMNSEEMKKFNEKLAEIKAAK
jgi:hypothetical protein